MTSKKSQIKCALCGKTIISKEKETIMDIIDDTIYTFDTNDRGEICSIVETKVPVDLGVILQQKSATFVWELMFTRSLFKTQDMIVQHHLLNTVADLVDSKEIKTTIGILFTPIKAENLRKAHKKLESGTTIAKLVLSGF
jgi:hypothetical protein